MSKSPTGQGNSVTTVGEEDEDSDTALDAKDIESASEPHTATVTGTDPVVAEVDAHTGTDGTLRDSAESQRLHAAQSADAPVEGETESEDPPTLSASSPVAHGELPTVAALSQPEPEGVLPLAHPVQTAPAAAGPSGAAVDNAVTTPVPSAAGTAWTPGKNIVGFISRVVYALGLAPQAGSGTGGAAQFPGLWAVLGWVRRGVGLGDAAVATPTAPPAAESVTEPVGQEVSPLGTTQQTAAETTAMETVCTLPVTLMKAVLWVAWRVTAQIQYSLIGGPDGANLDALGDAVDEYAMAAAFQQQILNSNEPTIVMQVAPPHDWYGVDAEGSRILYDNPDTIYRFAGVNYASEYVITGRMPDNPAAETTFSVLTGLSGSTAMILNGSELELGPDRTFVITASARKALPGEKNHLELTNDTTLIAIRDTLSDWNTQDPMSLEIHRTAGPPNSLFSQFGGFAIPVIGPAVSSSPLLTAFFSLAPPLPFDLPIVRGTVAAGVMVLGITQELTYIKVATTDATTGERKDANLFTDPVKNASFLSTQRQSAGYFQLADDEALVLTITPNNAGYFIVPVTDDWTITHNYWDDVTSLNIEQAMEAGGANPDGTYTIVVSKTDPGVANWVSTGGLNQGTMSIRFQDIDQADPNDPKVSSQVVKLAQLGSVLPSGTVYFTPLQRAEQILERKAGFDRRFAPYPQP